MGYSGGGQWKSSSLAMEAKVQLTGRDRLRLQTVSWSLTRDGTDAAFSTYRVLALRCDEGLGAVERKRATEEKTTSARVVDIRRTFAPKRVKWRYFHACVSQHHDPRRQR